MGSEANVPKFPETCDCFTFIKDATSLLPILEKRLPLSSNLYNMALFSAKFEDVLKFYTFRTKGGAAEDEVWILSMYFREDYGMESFISTNAGAQVTPEIKDAFANSSLFDWKNPYIFGVFGPDIALMLVEISIQHGKSINVKPGYLYYAPEPQQPEKQSASFDLMSLNSEDGIRFIMATWKFCVDGSREYISRVLERNPSVGCTVDGKLVSGILTVGNGTMGMLYTDKAYRNRNFGKICMLSLAQKLALEGYKPCSMVETENATSHAFHGKIGMKRVEPQLCFVYYQRSEF